MWPNRYSCPVALCSVALRFPGLEGHSVFQGFEGFRKRIVLHPYHPATKDGILNPWGIFYAIRWHNIFEIPPPWIFYAIPWARPDYLKYSWLPYILPKFIAWKIAISRTWLPKKIGCITYSKVGLSRILLGNPMALHIPKFQVHSDFVSMPSFLARWYQRVRSCSTYLFSS